MFAPAAGTAAGAGEAAAVFEDEPAGETLGRSDLQLPSAGRNRSLDVGEMGVDFFLLDSEVGRQPPGGVFRFLEQIDDLLPEGFVHLVPLI